MVVLATNAFSSEKDDAKEEMVGAVPPDDPTECVDVFEVNNSVILWKCYATFGTGYIDGVHKVHKT